MALLHWSLLLPLFMLLPLLLLFLRRRDEAKYKLPPGPRQLPFIGNLHHLGELMHRSFYELSKEHGPLMYLKLGRVKAVVASSAETAREFLETHDLDCCSRPYHTSHGKLSYGCRDVAFAPYGEQWRELRKISIIHFFSTKKVKSFRLIRKEEVERMVNSIASQTSEINLSEELLSLSNNITCRTALGKRYHEGESVYEMLRETQALFTAFFVGDYFPRLRWVDWVTGIRVRLERNFRDLDTFYQQVIEEHRGSMAGEQSGDAVDALLDIQKNKDTHLTDEHIKGLLMNIFIGGSDTSSTTIEWAMSELMRNPRVMNKAQDELRAIIGNKGMVEEDDLQRLNYLKLVVKETMRLHPPLPLLVERETIRDCQINGFCIPARTRLFVSAWAIGRDKTHWERPNDFNPERFANSCTDFWGHNFQLIPFGAGRRICPGMQSGIFIVELALANLLYLFNWKSPNGMSNTDINMDEAPGITVHKKIPLYLIARKYFNIEN